MRKMLIISMVFSIMLLYLSGCGGSGSVNSTSSIVPVDSKSTIIEGTVYETNNQPAGAGYVVKLTQISASSGSNSSQSTTTNDQGQYMFNVNGGGTYMVQAMGKDGKKLGNRQCTVTSGTTNQLHLGGPNGNGPNGTGTPNGTGDPNTCPYYPNCTGDPNTCVNHQNCTGDPNTCVQHQNCPIDPNNCPNQNCPYHQ